VGRAPQHAAASPFASQILHVVHQEARASQVVLVQCAKDRAAFEDAWHQWMDRQCRVAMAQPLPKVCSRCRFAAHARACLRVCVRARALQGVGS